MSLSSKNHMLIKKKKHILTRKKSFDNIVLKEVCFAQYQGSSACLGPKSRHGQTGKIKTRVRKRD